ncbi:MAG: hypothetical protein P1V51_13855 [Deltaproteobacteria bacterium]|nr:hypothetical protein [Deltaproteobacteria bacterium]
MKWPSLPAILAALALGVGAAPSFPAAAEASGAYLGTQRVRGILKLPVLGEVDTEVTFTVLATIQSGEEGLSIEQRPCSVEFSNVLGIGTAMEEAGVRRLPVEKIAFGPAEGDWRAAEPWLVGWGAEDVDADGKPGATVQVKAPLCGGEVHVSSQTVSIARGQWTGETFRGRVKVVVAQKILGASNACLSMTATDKRQKMSGEFEYRPVPAGTRCEDLGALALLAGDAERP